MKHSILTVSHPVQIWLDQSQTLITLQGTLNIVSVQSVLMNMKQIKK